MILKALFGLKDIVKLDKTGTAFKTAENYGVQALKFLRNKVTNTQINTIEGIATAATVGTLATGAIAGQASGGIADFFTGFADLNQEQFREDGGDQTGTTVGTFGKIAQNTAIAAISLIPKANLVSKFGAKGVNMFYKSIIGWQAASVGSDWVWDDHGGMVEDTADTASGLACMARFGKLLLCKG